MFSKLINSFKQETIPEISTSSRLLLGMNAVSTSIASTFDKQDVIISHSNSQCEFLLSEIKLTFKSPAKFIKPYMEEALVVVHFDNTVTTWSLETRDPILEVAVMEKNIVGFDIGRSKWAAFVFEGNTVIFLNIYTGEKSPLNLNIVSVNENGTLSLRSDDSSQGETDLTTNETSNISTVKESDGTDTSSYRTNDNSTFATTSSISVHRIKALFNPIESTLLLIFIDAQTIQVYSAEKHIVKHTFKLENIIDVCWLVDGSLFFVVTPTHILACDKTATLLFSQIISEPIETVISLKAGKLELFLLAINPDQERLILCYKLKIENHLNGNGVEKNHSIWLEKSNHILVNSECHDFAFFWRSQEPLLLVHGKNLEIFSLKDYSLIPYSESYLYYPYFNRTKTSSAIYLPYNPPYFDRKYEHDILVQSYKNQDIVIWNIEQMIPHHILKLKPYIHFSQISHISCDLNYGYILVIAGGHVLLFKYATQAVLTEISKNAKYMMYFHLCKKEKKIDDLDKTLRVLLPKQSTTSLAKFYLERVNSVTSINSLASTTSLVDSGEKDFSKLVNHSNEEDHLEETTSEPFLTNENTLVRRHGFTTHFSIPDWYPCTELIFDTDIHLSVYEPEICIIATISTIGLVIVDVKTGKEVFVDHYPILIQQEIEKSDVFLLEFLHTLQGIYVVIASQSKGIQLYSIQTEGSLVFTKFSLPDESLHNIISISPIPISIVMRYPVHGDILVVFEDSVSFYSLQGATIKQTSRTLLTEKCVCASFVNDNDYDLLCVVSRKSVKIYQLPGLDIMLHKKHKFNSEALNISADGQVWIRNEEEIEFYDLFAEKTMETDIKIQRSPVVPIIPTTFDDPLDASLRNEPKKSELQEALETRGKQLIQINAELSNVEISAAGLADSLKQFNAKNQEKKWYQF